MVSSVPTDPSMVRIGSVWNSQYLCDTLRMSSAVSSARKRCQLQVMEEDGRVFTVEIYYGPGSVIGYSATFVEREALAGQLEQR